MSRVRRVLGRTANRPAAVRARVAATRLGRESPGVRVLLYHGLVEKRTDDRLERGLHTIDEFRSHLADLGRHPTIGVAELVAPHPPTVRHAPVLVTFDDGYASSLIAAELLAEVGRPLLLFVTTGPLGSPRSIWTSELALLLLHGEAAGVDLLGRRWDLSTRGGRERAFAGIRAPLKAMSAQARRAHLAELEQQFPAAEVERLVESHPGFAMLAEGEVSELASEGVEIGSHGMNHEPDNGSQSSDVLRKEVAGAKAQIEAITGQPCRSFAYPNGDHRQSVPLLREAGYETAFTTSPGLVTEATDRHLLPRLVLSNEPVRRARVLHRGRAR